MYDVGTGGNDKQVIEFTCSHVYVAIACVYVCLHYQMIAASNWEIEIHFHQYNNPSGTKGSTGTCCSGG